MISYIIPLLSTFLNSGFWDWILPVLILCFIATVPCIIRSIIDFRR